MRNIFKTKKPLFSFETKVKQSFHRYYFDAGFSLLGYIRYLIIIIGIDKVVNKDNLNGAIIWGVLYGIICYIIGYFYVKSDYAKAATEVSNRINKFVEEMRSNMKKKLK